MQNTDSDHLLKRINRKKKSSDIAIRLKIFVEANYPEDEKFIKNAKKVKIECENHRIVTEYFKEMSNKKYTYNPELKS